MIANQISDMKRGLKSTVAMAGWGLLAAIAIGIAVLWFAVALFIFLADRYDALTASLAVGGCFVLLAVIAALAAFTIHRQRERERIAAAKAAANVNATAWLEPALIAAGLDIARMIGGRRAVSLAAGAAAVVWLLNKANSESAGRRRTTTRYPS
ncbi:MAG: hypothetical protein K2Z80_30945 [Xanthobacteraceae bacterium]|nr:hypothetical protein [Xanthobacteraceae bacterium]